MLVAPQVVPGLAQLFPDDLRRTGSIRGGGPQLSDEFRQVSLVVARHDQQNVGHTAGTADHPLRRRIRIAGGRPVAQTRCCRRQAFAERVKVAVRFYCRSKRGNPACENATLAQVATRPAGSWPRRVRMMWKR